MGLESLFLKGGETQEIIYRLGIRIAKIFSLLGYDSNKVKEIVIIMIFMKEEKEEFLDLIDDSLVDKDKDSQLNNLLNTARNVISGG